MKQTVYIASPESQQIHVWNLNHEGALTLTQVVDVPGQVQPMVVSPDKRYLSVGVRPEFRVLAYRIAPDDGALTFAAESALPGSPTHISTDHQGQFVFVGSYNAGNVSVTRLEDGLPVGVVDVVEGLDGCHSANISPDNRTLWVPALKQDRICLFTVSDDGHIFWQINWTKRAKVCSEQFLDFCFCCCFKEVSSQVVFQFDFIELVVSYKQSHYRLFICDVDQGLDGLLLRNF